MNAPFFRLSLLLWGVFLTACTNGPKAEQFGELSVKSWNTDFERSTGTFQIKTSVSNLVRGKTNEKNRTKHLGWWAGEKLATKISAKIKVNEIANARCQSNQTPALTRAGLGGFLKAADPNKPGQHYFAFTGILVGRGIPGVVDGIPHAFYVLMECRNVCFVLDAYAPSPEERAQVLAFHAEPIKESEESFGIGVNTGKLEFERAGKKWGEIALPLAVKGARELAYLGYNVGHFVPLCPEELVQHAEARFSEVQGF